MVYATFNIHQLIATTVVASFTEHNLHPELNTLIPVVMICMPKPQMCFYDCKDEPFVWLDHDKNLNKVATLLLWMTGMYVVCYENDLTFCTFKENVRHFRGIQEQGS